MKLNLISKLKVKNQLLPTRFANLILQGQTSKMKKLLKFSKRTYSQKWNDLKFHINILFNIFSICKYFLAISYCWSFSICWGISVSWGIGISRSLSVCLSISICWCRRFCRGLRDSRCNCWCNS